MENNDIRGNIRVLLYSSVPLNRLALSSSKSFLKTHFSSHRWISYDLLSNEMVPS